MNWVNPLLDLNEDCETAVANVTARLIGSGLRVVRSFDLQSACASSPSQACPHHGQGPCDCQLVILMVYDTGGQPDSLVLHTCDGQTQVGLAAIPGRINIAGLEKRIRAALCGAKRVVPILEAK